VNCDWELLGETGEKGNALRCRRCQRVVRSTNVQLRAICRAAGPSSPGTPKKLLNFTRAAIGHYLAGSPTCTQEEIEARLAICRGCALYAATPGDDSSGTCTHVGCGCSLSSQRRYLNKLAWADQACPLEKWPAIERATDARDQSDETTTRA